MGWLFSLPLIDGHRARRVGELISIVWLLAVADLAFTLWAHWFTAFHELNPLARYFLKQGLIPSLILFKLVVTLIGTRLFWVVRLDGRAELALWGMVGVYVALAVRWGMYTSSALAMSGNS
jgi:hypothetical protein